MLTYDTHPAIDIQEVADALAPAGIKVVGIDCYELDTLCKDIATLGTMFDELAAAARLTVFFQDIPDSVESKVTGIEEKPRVYAEHHGGDYMAFGAGSPWHEMIEMAGGINIFADMPMPYPEVDPEAVIERNPQVILKDTRGTPPVGYGVTGTEPIEAYIYEFIARALAQEPQVLLLDEPTSNLDLRHQLEVMGIVRSIVKERGIAAVMAIHDLNLAARFSDKLIFLDKGRICDAGEPAEVLTEVNIRVVYGVEAVVEKNSGIPHIIPLAPVGGNYPSSSWGERSLYEGKAKCR